MRSTVISTFALAAALAAPAFAQQQQTQTPATAEASQTGRMPALQAARQQLQTAAVHLRQASQGGDQQAIEQAGSTVQQAIDQVRQAMSELSPAQRANVQETLRQAEEGLQISNPAARIGALDRLIDVVAVVAVPVPAPSAGSASGAEAPSLANWDYEKLYADGWRADHLIDATVHGPTGEEIGEVENVIVGPDGKILSIIAEVGGFLDIGDTHVNVPWSEVEKAAEGEGVKIPITQETAENYTLFPDNVITIKEAKATTGPVNDDLATGPRAWKLTSLLHDYVGLTDVPGYGFVDDVIFDKQGQLQAVVVQPDVSWGTPGYYAYPYYGWTYGWHPMLDYYQVPYTKNEVAQLDTFDYDKLEGDMAATN
jgi:sporulation protein YlmC with PRC-barrel domain